MLAPTAAHGNLPIRTVLAEMLEDGSELNDIAQAMRKMKKYLNHVEKAGEKLRFLAGLSAVSTPTNKAGMLEIKREGGPPG